jgi:hypothetical protein
MINTLEGLELYPWEQRIEKALFRGRPTGVNQDYFQGYNFPSPEEVKDIVLAKPEAWSRPYLAWLGFYN